MGLTLGLYLKFTNNAEPRRKVLLSCREHLAIFYRSLSGSTEPWLRPCVSPPAICNQPHQTYGGAFPFNWRTFMRPAGAAHSHRTHSICVISKAWWNSFSRKIRYHRKTDLPGGATLECGSKAPAFKASTSHRTPYRSRVSSPFHWKLRL